MIPAVVLLHSPFVGPLTWAGVGEHLAGAGVGVVIPSLLGSESSSGLIWRAQVEAVARAIVMRTLAEPRVLVAHSGAGPLLPAIAAAIGGDLSCLFVDAGLPHPGRNRLESLPADLAVRLRSLARDGVLPPWQDWFEANAISRMVADPETAGRFLAEVPRLPLRLLEEPMPDLDLGKISSGYLQLSEAYAAEATAARRMRWPVDRFPGHHLSMLTQPAQVAERILSWLDRVG